MDAAYWNERIEKTKAVIELWETAESQLASGVQSYTIDTGQSRQTVTQANITEVRKYLESLYARLAAFEARVGKCGTTRMAPGW